MELRVQLRSTVLRKLRMLCELRVLHVLRMLRGRVYVRIRSRIGGECVTRVVCVRSRVRVRLCASCACVRRECREEGDRRARGDPLVHGHQFCVFCLIVLNVFKLFLIRI